jgi:hypothetical protein
MKTKTTEKKKKVSLPDKELVIQQEGIMRMMTMMVRVVMMMETRGQ